MNSKKARKLRKMSEAAIEDIPAAEWCRYSANAEQITLHEQSGRSLYQELKKHAMTKRP